MSAARFNSSIALFEVLMALKLPKRAELIGTDEGVEVRLPNGPSFLIKPIDTTARD